MFALRACNPKRLTSSLAAALHPKRHSRPAPALHPHSTASLQQNMGTGTVEKVPASSLYVSKPTWYERAFACWLLQHDSAACLKAVLAHKPAAASRTCSSPRKRCLYWVQRCWHKLCTPCNRWLTSRFHFSFSEYWDPQRTNFGALRVVSCTSFTFQRGG